jgi:hypothetical protein
MMNTSDLSALKAVREKLSASITAMRNSSGPRGHVVIDSRGFVLSSRTGTFERSITEALVVDPAFTPAILGGVAVVPLDEARELFTRRLRVELQSIEDRLSV